MTQPVVIVHIFRAYCNGENSLRLQFRDAVFATVGVTVLEKILSQTDKQVEALFDFAPDDRTAVGNQSAVAETDGDLVLKNRANSKFDELFGLAVGV